jgi:hypothetical protein
MSLLQAGFGSSGEYTIDDSLRFRSSADAYLSRTPASATNQKTWTWSAWVKRGTLTSGQELFGANPSSASGDTTWTSILFNDSDQFRVTGFSTAWRTTSQVFRDSSAWYHFVVAWDTTQSTATDRVKIYVNGSQVTSFAASNAPTLNTDYAINSTVAHVIGSRQTWASDTYFDGYMTEINFIDGQALTADDFGEFDDNGTWKPLAYTGTYGTNGFYLNGVGVTDESGNGNDWTNNNLNLSTSTADTYDQMKDTPSLVDENAGNFWTFNPLIPVTGADYSNGNLQYTSTSANKSGFASPLPTTGKWYWEGEWLTNGGGSNPVIGIAQAGFENTQGADGELGYRTTGNKFDEEATEIAYGASWTIGDVIGVVVDMDAGTIGFYKNGVSQGTAFTTVLTALTQPVKPMFRVNVANDVLSLNFGQRPFAYTPPSGFLKLNTFNLPDSTIEKGADYFNTVLYTGTGAIQSITVGFQPDFSWFKKRSSAESNILQNSIAGNTKFLISNSTAVEDTSSALIQSFNIDGVTIGASSTINGASTTYVAWNWLASNTTASNTDGDTPSTVSPNTTAGFSVVSYTGSGYLGTGLPTTVGHGLGVAPKFIFLKSRTTVEPWLTYHGSLGGTQYVFLNQTDKANSNIAFFNNTNPTSTVFSLGNSAAGNTNAATYIAYCFAEVPGYSAFGSYEGNANNDGPFVYTGFRPSFLIVKSVDSTSDWLLTDSKRIGFNPDNEYMEVNNANAEGTVNTVDFVSNGFKLRDRTTDPNVAETYIYMAFAESPFKNSNAR